MQEVIFVGGDGGLGVVFVQPWGGIEGGDLVEEVGAVEVEFGKEVEWGGRGGEVGVRAEERGFEYEVQQRGGAGEEAKDLSLDEDGEDGGVEVRERGGDAGGGGGGWGERGGWGWVRECAGGGWGGGERGQDAGLSIGDKGAANNVESVYIQKN